MDGAGQAKERTVACPSNLAAKGRRAILPGFHAGGAPDVSVRGFAPTAIQDRAVGSDL